MSSRTSTRRPRSQLVVLDNEAVQALADAHHPKHRRVVGYLQVLAQRKRRALEVRVAVPTSVRVEAGWDRTAPHAASLNRWGIADLALDTALANTAATIRQRTGVSVADAHIGAAIESSDAARCTVISSDPDDMRTVAGSNEIVVVAI